MPGICSPIPYPSTPRFPMPDTPAPGAFPLIPYPLVVSYDIYSLREPRGGDTGMGPPGEIGCPPTAPGTRVTGSRMGARPRGDTPIPWYHLY